MSNKTYPSVKFGKGAGNSFSCPLGGLSICITKEMLDMTLRELATELAKQRKIVNGNIDFSTIELCPRVRSE